MLTRITNQRSFEGGQTGKQQMLEELEKKRSAHLKLFDRQAHEELVNKGIRQFNFEATMACVFVQTFANELVMQVSLYLSRCVNVRTCIYSFCTYSKDMAHGCCEDLSLMLAARACNVRVCARCKRRSCYIYVKIHTNVTPAYLHFVCRLLLCVLGYIQSMNLWHKFEYMSQVKIYVTSMIMSQV